MFFYFCSTFSSRVYKLSFGVWFCFQILKYTSRGSFHKKAQDSMPKITSKNKLKKRKICSQLDNLKTVKCNKKNSAVTQSTEEIKFIKI